MSTIGGERDNLGEGRGPADLLQLAVSAAFYRPHRTIGHSAQSTYYVLQMPRVTAKPCLRPTSFMSLFVLPFLFSLSLGFSLLLSIDRRSFPNGPGSALSFHCGR